MTVWQWTLKLWLVILLLLSAQPEPTKSPIAADDIRQRSTTPRATGGEMAHQNKFPMKLRIAEEKVANLPAADVTPSKRSPAAAATSLRPRLPWSSFKNVMVALYKTSARLRPVAPVYFASAAVAALPMQQGRRLPEEDLPRIPRTAALLALADMKTLRPEIAAQRFYIWCPNGSLEEHAIARLAVNIAVSHSPVDYNPSAIAGGALMPVDLLALCPDKKDFDRTIGVWHSQSDIEPYAHIQLVDWIDELVNCDPWTDKDGHRFTQRWEKRRHVRHVAAPHLGSAGIELERLAGNPTPGDQSFCPIVRLDWFLWCSLSSIDGAKYLDFRGLKAVDPNDPKSKDKATKLDDYLKDRGVNQEFIKRKNSDNRAAFISKELTGHARGVNAEQGQGTRLTEGHAIVVITDDNFFDRDQPQQDPFYSLLDHQPDAHEVILVQANGWPEYTLFNGQGQLISEAPPNVVDDDKIPAPFRKRLNGAISCLRCHGPHDNWKPFRNEVQDTLADRSRILFDASGKNNQTDNLTRIASLYTGDLEPAMQVARNEFDRKCFGISGLPAKKLTAAVSELYAAHEYTLIGAKEACAELGIEVPAQDSTGAITFRRVVPPKSLDGSIPDDPLIARLHSDYLDGDTAKRVGLVLTRRQWELIYGDAMDRALVHGDQP